MLLLELSADQPISTERLHLLPIAATDAPAFHVMRSDPEVMRYIPRTVSQQLSETEALIAHMEKDRAENKGITWAVHRKGSPGMIGTIGYYRIQPEHHRGEVGYLLAPAHQGKGLMGEALEAVVAHGFSVLGFHSIEAVTDPRNTPSNRLLERHGFIREGLFKENFYWNGEFQDSAVWGRLRSR